MEDLVSMCERRCRKACNLRSAAEDSDEACHSGSSEGRARRYRKHGSPKSAARDAGAMDTDPSPVRLWESEGHSEGYRTAYEPPSESEMSAPIASVFCGLLSPRPPPVRCSVGPCLPAFFSRGVPLSRAPCRASWLLLCPVCPCCPPLLWRVGVLCFLFFFVFTSTARHSSLPPAFRSVLCPPPLSPRCLLAVLAPFLGGWRRWGWGGGRPRCPSSGVSTAQARRRHEARHLSLCRGGGLPCGSRRHPTYPAVAPPVVPPLGLARRVLPLGTVVWSVPHPLSAASPPCRGVLGGESAFRYRHPPCRPCRFPFVARTSQA